MVAAKSATSRRPRQQCDTRPLNLCREAEEIAPHQRRKKLIEESQNKIFRIFVKLLTPKHRV